MSEAVPTIPNYCSYETFKTGLSDGLGVCYNEESHSCGKAYPSKIRAKYHGREHTTECGPLLTGQANYNRRYMLGKSRASKGIEWFDGNSLSRRQYGVLNGGKSGDTTHSQVDDHHQDIEDVLSERLQSACPSNSDSGLSSSRNSTAKSWKRMVDKECFYYSKEKGCIDWLETKCHNQGLRKTNSDKELIKSFETQLIPGKSVGGHHSALRLNYFLISQPGMLPACPHLTRKFGTDNSSSEDVRALNSGESGEGTLEEEVFDDELYYLGVPQVS